MTTGDADRWPALTWFRDWLEVDLLRANWEEMSSALSHLPGFDLVRVERVVTAGAELYEADPPRSHCQLVLFLDAALGLDVTKGAVGREARRWIDLWAATESSEPRHPSTAALWGFFLDWWARDLLLWTGESPSQVDVPETVGPTAAWSVADWVIAGRVVEQLCGFFVRRVPPVAVASEEAERRVLALATAPELLRTLMSKGAAETVVRLFIAPLPGEPTLLRLVESGLGDNRPRQESERASAEEALRLLLERVSAEEALRLLLAGTSSGEPLELNPWELSDEFQDLIAQGLPRDRLSSLVLHWLSALHRTQEWEAVKGVSQSYARVTWPRLASRLSLWRHLGDQERHSPEADAPDLVSLQPLNYWLYAVSVEGDDERIPLVATVLLRAWERLRDSLEGDRVTDFDANTFWGSGGWALGALVRRLEYLRKASPLLFHGEHEIVGLLVRSLESFSARMALNRFPFPPNEATPAAAPQQHPGGKPTLASDAAPENPVVPDPAPGSYPLGVPHLPFAEKGNPPLASPSLPSERGPLDSPAQPRSRCSPKDYAFLTRDMETASVQNAIPPGVAFLGCYDLPGTGQPVLALAVRDPGGDLIVEMATRPTERTTHGGDVGLADFDSRVTRAWIQYATDTKDGPTDAALMSIAGKIGFFLQDRHKFLNRLYGPVVEELLGRIERRGIDISQLQGTDLVVCVRGKASNAALEFLGTDRPLGSLFASVSVTPCLRLFELLSARLSNSVGAPSLTRRPLRLSVAGWEPRRADHPGHGTMVRHLMTRILEQFEPLTQGLDPLLSLHLAAESPMASVPRAEAMMSATDWGIVFGHGSRSPYGVRLSDGLYPGPETPPVNAIDAALEASVIFVCGCFTGRLVQSSLRPDALSPILDELSLSLLLRPSRPTARRPTCVGAFINEIPGRVGADFLVELIQERIKRATEGATAGPAGFQFARSQQELIRRCLGRLGLGVSLAEGRNLQHLATGSASQAQDILSLFTALSFRIVGVEPVLTR